jgi:glycosyltransferase involved in cell wall biosynthesis
MRILSDCRYVRTDHHDGISRYSARITEALARRAAANGHTVTMLISDERQLGLLPDLPWAIGPSPTSPAEPWVARKLNRLGADVVFTPLQTMGTLARRRYRLVKTLHDLIYHRHRTPPRDLPGFVRLLWRLYHLAWWPQRALLNRADAVATVSDTTRQLIAEHRLTRRPVIVVPNAADPAPDGAPVDRPAPALDSEHGRDLVYMGSFMPYKNVETLARAMHELPGHRLHLLSRIAPAARARLEASAPAGSLVVHDGTSEAEYRQLLLSCRALVTASRDEGFGLPLVEAMVLGTPIVVSDIPIFREIGGDAALYAPADDAVAFAEAVRRLEDADEWRTRSAAARAQAARFDWDHSAAVLLAELEKLVG